MKISGVYKITNIETNECYIGSSVDVNERWRNHKKPSRWKQCQNKKLYIDFQQYGLDKFKFEIVEKTTKLKEREQYWIDLLKPSYNNARANGFDFEREKERHKTEKYRKREKAYRTQLCLYKGEVLTLCALATRFRRKGISHQILEAKKYLIKKAD